MDMFYQKGVSVQKGKEQASDIGQHLKGMCVFYVCAVVDSPEVQYSLNTRM